MPAVWTAPTFLIPKCGRCLVQAVRWPWGWMPSLNFLPASATRIAMKSWANWINWQSHLITNRVLLIFLILKLRHLWPDSKLYKMFTTAVRSNVSSALSVCNKALKYTWHWEMSRQVPRISLSLSLFSTFLHENNRLTYFCKDCGKRAPLTLQGSRCHCSEWWITHLS